MNTYWLICVIFNMYHLTKFLYPKIKEGEKVNVSVLLGFVSSCIFVAPLITILIIFYKLRLK